MKQIKNSLKDLKSKYWIFVLIFHLAISCQNNGSITVSEYLDGANKKDTIIIHDTIVVVNQNEVMIFDSKRWITLNKVPEEDFLPVDSTDNCRGRRVYRNNCFPCHIKIPEKNGIKITFKNKFFELNSNSIEELDRIIELTDNGKPIFIGKDYFIKHETHDYYWTISRKNKELLINYLKTVYPDSIEPCSDNYIVP